MSSQFDYEPPTARQPRHTHHMTAWYRWVGPLLLITFVVLVIMAAGAYVNSVLVGAL